MSDEMVRLIPKGMYCYSRLVPYMREDGTPRVRTEGVCPFWRTYPDKPKQVDGYCFYLGKGDWDSDGFTGLLWDMIKACGENYDYDEKDEPENPSQMFPPSDEK